jgi:guanine deaminase
MHIKALFIIQNFRNHNVVTFHFYQNTISCGELIALDMVSKFMQRAIELARYGMETNNGGPFGCVIVKDGNVIAEGYNRVTSDNDPTAHAEIVAIRNACKALNNFQLNGCDIYTSCEPCPMCLGAIYWARPEKVFFAATRNDAADAGFDDDIIYSELTTQHADRRIPFIQVQNDEAANIFKAWKKKENKVGY